MFLNIISSRFAHISFFLLVLLLKVSAFATSSGKADDLGDEDKIETGFKAEGLPIHDIGFKVVSAAWDNGVMVVGCGHEGFSSYTDCKGFGGKHTHEGCITVDPWDELKADYVENFPFKFGVPDKLIKKLGVVYMEFAEAGPLIHDYTPSQVSQMLVDGGYYIFEFYSMEPKDLIAMVHNLNKLGFVRLQAGFTKFDELTPWTKNPFNGRLYGPNKDGIPGWTFIYHKTGKPKADPIDVGIRALIKMETDRIERQKRMMHRFKKVESSKSDS